MDRQLAALPGAVKSVVKWPAALRGHSERTILLGTVLIVSGVSVVTGFFLAHYFSVDVISSVVFTPDDCALRTWTKVGRHCFGDYAELASLAEQPNPWDPPLYYLPDSSPENNNYPAAAMVPPMIFGLLGRWLGAPGVGLAGYLLVLVAGTLLPAGWAARGASGLERLVIFGALGIAAVPAWMVFDRANTVGLVVPIALVFLVALCRRRWGLVTLMVVLAALVKPQFAVLIVVLFAARQWRWGAVAVAGIGVPSLAAYLLWPRDFPDTIIESIRYALGYGGGSLFRAAVAGSNVSFSKGLLAIPDAFKAWQTGGKIPDGFLATPRSLLGYAVLLIVVVSVLALGRRLPPVMAGILLLATGALFPTLSNPYYVVFVLPVAALVVRDPDGPPGTGIFDRPSGLGGHRRAVGVTVSIASALCIAQFALPSQPHRTALTGGQSDGPIGPLIVDSTVAWVPLLWLVACGTIIGSYLWRPAEDADDDCHPGTQSAEQQPV